MGEKRADDPDMLGADTALALPRGGVLQPGRQRLPDQRTARPEIGGLLDQAQRVAAINPQIIGQNMRQLSTKLLCRGTLPEPIDQWIVTGYFLQRWSGCQMAVDLLF